MDQVNRFLNDFDKTTDLINRGFAAYPIKRDIATLKQRHDANDPNVVAYVDEKGHTFDYALEFTDKQRKELEDGFKHAAGTRLFVEDDAEIFVGILEKWGDAIPDFQSIASPPHKARQRAIASFVNAVEKVDYTLAELDSSALGWLYAHVTDKLSNEGVQVSPDDGGMVSMRNHPVQAMVEAGEMRSELRKLVSAIVSAASDARDTLPLSDRVENDPRLQMAKALERQIIENRIEFSTSETGFPAQCLRAVFELGGLEVERVSYWLKKAADDPDSFANYRQRMQGKTQA